jgi:RNA polymerase sigma-70 factor (ECF subfamily)
MRLARNPALELPPLAMDSELRELLIARARRGEPHALSELFDIHQPRLVRMIELRLDATLRRRLDPADVVQEAWVDVVERFPQWCEQDSLPFHVWLRLTTSQALAEAQRRHLAAGKRDVQREVAGAHSRPSVTAVSAANAFIASATSPTQAASREELRLRVLAALEELDEMDREIVALRHFEGLSNEEAAAELAIEPAAASKRFVRALLRLKPALQSLAPEAAQGMP